MDSAPAFRWALTGVYVACAGLHLARVLATDSRPARVAWSLHMLMAAAMVAMTWPWGMHVSAIVYVLVFTAGALHFAYLNLVAGGIGHTVYHGVMASIVLMALAMSSTSGPAASRVGPMGAMNMAGGSASGAAPSDPTWVILACGVAAAFFVGAALRSFFVVIQGPGVRSPTCCWRQGWGCRSQLSQSEPRNDRYDERI